MKMETNVNPDNDWTDNQWIENEIDQEDKDCSMGIVDGYDVITVPWWPGSGRIRRVYRVYTWNCKNNRTIKHYHYGYSSYKQMLSKHPELKR